MRHGGGSVALWIGSLGPLGRGPARLPARRAYYRKPRSPCVSYVTHKDIGP